MDEYQLYATINMLLLYRNNRTDKLASVGTHSDPTRVREKCHIGSAIWLVGNHMHLLANKEYLYS